jgi:uncharacterized membrane protein
MSHEKLWLAAILTQLGDIATTYYGITQLGLPEVNPFAQHMFESIGLIPSLLLIKVALFVLAYLVTQYDITSHKWVAPACITFVGTVVVAINTLTISMAL